LIVSIDATDREIYEMSKLKKFMIAIRFMMQDSVRYLMLDSLYEFVDHISKETDYTIEVKSCNEVNVIILGMIDLLW
jgi:dynein heavy chain